MLEHIELFAGLPPEDLAVVEACAQTRHYRKGTVILSQGDTADSLYLVLAGELRAYMANEDGKEVTLGSLKTGEAFGELALLDGEPRSASVITVDNASLAVIPRQCFEQALESCPGIALNLLNTLARRNRALLESLSSLALMDVYGRVARILLAHAREEDGVMVVDRLTHQEIAGLAGSSREMVSKIMKDLRTGGYISVDDRYIRINQRLPSRW